MADKKTYKFLVALQTAEFKKGLNNIKRQLSTFKSFLTGAFALGSITVFGKKMVEAGKDFEDAMARVKAVSNATETDFKSMEKEARKLGSTTRYSALECANALENLTRNGMSAKQATAALSGVLKLAQANAIGLAESADIVTNSLNMFGLSVSSNNVQRVNDVLSTTAAHTATNVSLLYEAMVNAAPVAHTLGISIEEVAAALGALANKGVKGAEAGTQLRMALVKMSDPLIVKKLNEMGVAIDENFIKQNKLIGTLGELKNANLSFANLVSAFSQKGAAGIQQLINTYDNFLTILGYTENAAGTVDRMFRDGVGSVKKELDLLNSMFNSFLIDMSNKTSSVFKFFVQQAQNIVRNFKTLGGTILNIASVAVPLLANKIYKLAIQTKRALTIIKKEAIAVKLALGGWIAIIGTIVTWVGTYLYGAWLKANSAIRDAKKEMETTEADAIKLNSKLEYLIDTLEKNGKESLNGVIEETTKLLPDFAEEIRNVAEECAKTNNYDKLINKLREIGELQNLIAMEKASSDLVDANIAQGAARMRMAPYISQKEAGLGNLADFFKNTNVPKEIQEAIYGEVLKAAINNKTKEEINKLVSDLTNGMVTSIDFQYNKIKGLVDNIVYGRKYKGENNVLKGKITRLAETNTGTTSTITTTENNVLEGDYKKLSDEITSYNEKLKELQNQYAAGALTEKEFKDSLDDLEDKTWKAITAVSGFAKLMGNLGSGSTVSSLQKAFNENRANENQALVDAQAKALAKYTVPTKGTRNTSLDYSKKGSEIVNESLDLEEAYSDAIKGIIEDIQEGIGSGDFELVKQDAINKMEEFKTLLEESLANAEKLENALVLSDALEDLQKQMKDLKSELSSTITDLATSFERLYNSIASIIEAFGASLDDDTKEKFQKFFSVINAGVQIFETFKTIAEAIQLIEDIQAKKKALNAGKIVAANIAITSSEKLKAEAQTAAAVAGGASSLAGIPLVGAGLAVAAAGSIIAAILLATKKAKFAKGGIVGGNSYSGDNNIIRANSGELILNRQQQATLWGLLNGKGSIGGSEVIFKIKGSDLVGTLNNYTNKKRG